MLSQKTSRWLSALIMLLLALRLGKKYAGSQPLPENEAQLASIRARVQALADSIEAEQEVSPGPDTAVVVADSSVLAADTVARRK